MDVGAELVVARERVIILECSRVLQLAQRRLVVRMENDSQTQISGVPKHSHPIRDLPIPAQHDDEERGDEHWDQTEQP